MTAWKKLAYLIFVFLVCSPLWAQDDYRQWSSLDGKYTIEAVFAGREGDAISLKKRDGSVVTLDLSKLSKADQQFLEIKAKGKTRSSPGKVKTVPLVSAARQLKYGEVGVWDVVPDPFVSTVQNVTEPIALEGEEHVSGELLISPKRSAVMYFDKSVPRKTGFRVFDLATGEITSAREEVPECRPLDVCPDESRIVVATGQMLRTRPSMLHVLVRGEQLNPLASWLPYGERGDVEYAQFVDDDHLLTVSNEGHMGLWNVNTLKLVWRTRVWPESTPGLSPNRKLLFARVEKGLAAIEPLTGRVLGLQPCDVIGLRKLSVNDGCTKLVGVGNGTARVWDLSTGKLVSDFAISAAVLGEEVHWVGDSQVLVQSRASGIFDLVDLDLQCSVWLYRFSAAPAIGADGRVWFGQSKHRNVAQPQLASARLPHTAAATAIRQASASGLTLFDYGSTLPLSLTFAGSLWNPSAVQENAKKMFESSGFTPSFGTAATRFVGELGGETFVDQGKQRQDNSQVDLTLVSNGALVWRARRDRSLYALGTQPFGDHPWKGYVIPRTFRFFGASLTASIPTSGGSFEQFFYDRDYSDGFIDSWSNSAEGLERIRQQNRDRKNGAGSQRRPGFPGRTPLRRGPPGGGRNFF